MAAILSGPCRADNEPLPSRRAGVVIPLLAKLAHKDDSRKTVVEALKRILGEPDSAETGSRGREYLEYQLDDKTTVTVIFLNGQFVMIMAPTLNDPDRTFYTKPN